jgi:type VI secretion system ImpA family protein
VSATTIPVNVDELLAPAEGSAPAGAELRYLPIFDEIKAARRAAEDEPTDSTPWKRVADLGAKALGRSKDLQLAIWLLESLARVDGFRGVSTGLVVVRRLLVEYWESLYPQMDPDDSEPLGFRRSLLDWIDQKLPAIVKTAPITAPPASFGLLHYEVTQKTGDEKKALLDEGWPSSERFDEALQTSTLKHLEGMLEEVMTSEAELAALQAVADQRFGPAAGPEGGERLSFSFLKETLETAHWLVERPIKKKQKELAATQHATDGSTSGTATEASTTFAVGERNGDQVWAEALNLTRGSRVEGLRLLQAQVATAICGRDRFLRQLQLGELCLEAGVHALAFPIFDDLARLIDSRQLEEWEDKILIARVWKGLVQCCSLLESQIPTAGSRKQEITDRLTRLDPAQAAQA